MFTYFTYVTSATNWDVAVKVSNEYAVLFTEQIFINSPWWNTLPSAYLKTHRWRFEFSLDFASLQSSQKLSQEFKKLKQVFEKPGRVFEKLERVFLLQHGLCCPNQPRYHKTFVTASIKELSWSLTFSRIGKYNPEHLRCTTINHNATISSLSV